MKSVSILSIVTLLVASTSPALAASDDARLEGLVMSLDGRPATGYQVHLIDDSGAERGHAAVDEGGSYTLDGISPGRYAFALQTPDGRFAAVDAPPVRVRDGHLVRRDFKLVERDPADPANLAQPAYGFGTWWAGLPVTGKVWTVVAVVVFLGFTAEALSSDETTASEFLTN